MPTVFWIVFTSVCFVLTGISIFFYVITKKGGESKVYCRLFNRSEWDGWENVIKNFDGIQFDYHHVNPDDGIGCYRFKLVIDGTECYVYYWEDGQRVSVHDYPGVQYGCLSSFDSYHSNLMKDMLCERFDFIKEAVEG